MDVRVGLWRKLSIEKLMLLNCAVGEDSWESLGLRGDPTSPSWRRSVLRVHWVDWCWSWNSNTLSTSCEELTHWKRSWCWEGLGTGGEGDYRGWDGWMPAGVQPQQDPGVPSGWMASARKRERERQRVTRWGGAAESGKSLFYFIFFYRSFYSLKFFIFKGKIV